MLSSSNLLFTISNLLTGSLSTLSTFPKYFINLSKGAIKAVQNKELALQIPSLVTEEGKVVT